MNNNIVSFKFHASAVRIITKDNEPLFCLADVCAVLNLSTPAKTASQIKEEFELGELNSYSFDTGFGVKDFTMITEPQLYFVMMRSRAKIAREFRHWVLNEVLPTIRKTGQYSTQPATASLTYKPEVKELAEVPAPAVKEPSLGVPNTPEMALNAPDSVSWYVFEVVDLLKGCYVSHSKIEKIIEIVKKAKRQGYDLARTRAVDYYSGKVKGYEELKRKYAVLLKDHKSLKSQVHFVQSEKDNVLEEDMKAMTRDMFNKMRADAHYIATHKDEVSRAMARGYLATGLRLLNLCDDYSFLK